MVIDLNLPEQVVLNNQSPFGYTKSLISEMLDNGYIALSNDKQLIQLANNYGGYAVSVIKEDEVLDAVVVFFVVNFLDETSQVFNDAIADEDLALEENFDIFFDCEIVGIYPEFVFKPCDFSIKKIIKQYSDFSFYYNKLLNDESDSIDELDETEIKLLLAYKMASDFTQKESILKTLVEKTGYQLDILKALSHKISEKPKLNLIT